jgi:hypothetical protein
LHKIVFLLLCCCRRVAEVEGLDESYIDRRIAGIRGDPISNKQHGRFAAAVLLDALVAHASSMQALEAAWGEPKTLTDKGVQLVSIISGNVVGRCSRMKG